MTSIKDVALEANVSTATVSRVLNQSSKASDAVVFAVHKAVKKLNYVPPKRGQNALGVLVTDVSEPFFGKMLKGADQIARNDGKHLLICNAYHAAKTEQEAIERLIKNKCSSIIAHSKWLDDEKLISYAGQVPGFVLINRYIEAIANRCVALDNVHGGYIATKHLLKNGHRDIGFLLSDQRIDDTFDRLRGHRKALEEFGVPFNEEYVVECCPSESGGSEGTNNLLAKNIPLTAIVTYNDEVAAGVLSTLHENHLDCPKDISVIGYDDSMIAKYLHPKLTTVRYPIDLMAERAAKLAIAMADQPKIHTAHFNFMVPTLVSRNSVHDRT